MTRYIHEMEIVKINTVNNISYAEACKRECSRKENNIKINKNVLGSKQHFPSLPTSTGTSPLAVRPPPVAYTNHDNVEIEVQEMDNIDHGFPTGGELPTSGKFKVFRWGINHHLKI